MSNNFQVVFHGLASSGTTTEQLKINIAKLYNTEVKNIESLFKGSAVVIKDNLDEATAHQYAEVFRKQGAQCELRDKSVLTTKESVRAPNAGHASGNEIQSTESAKGVDTIDQSTLKQEAKKVIEATATIASKPEKSSQIREQNSKAAMSKAISEEISASYSRSGKSAMNAGGISLAQKCTVALEEYVGSMGGISVADTGSTMVEIDVVDAPDIKTSHFEVAAAGETLIEFTEIAEPEISTDAFSLAAVGSDIKGASD